MNVYAGHVCVRYLLVFVFFDDDDDDDVVVVVVVVVVFASYLRVVASLYINLEKSSSLLRYFTITMTTTRLSYSTYLCIVHTTGRCMYVQRVLYLDATVEQCSAYLWIFDCAQDTCYLAC